MPVPGRAQQRLVADAALEAVDEPVDRLRLVAGRLERGDEPEVGHGLLDDTPTRRRDRTDVRYRRVAARRRTRSVAERQAYAGGTKGSYRTADRATRDSGHPRSQVGGVRARARHIDSQSHRPARDAARPVRASSSSRSILMPLFFILLGIIQFGFIFNTYVTMTNAARDAARMGTIYVYDRESG